MTDSKPFDFESFLKGIKPSRRTVTIFAVDNTDEIERLEGELDAEPVDTGKRFSQKSRTATLASEVTRLRDEMEASATKFTFKPLDYDDFEKIASLGAYEQLEKQAVEPVLSAEQWRKIAQAVGGAQFKELVAAATALTLEQVKTPPFSRSTLDALSTKGSDES